MRRQIVPPVTYQVRGGGVPRLAAQLAHPTAGGAPALGEVREVRGPPGARAGQGVAAWVGEATVLAPQGARGLVPRHAGESRAGLLRPPLAGGQVLSHVGDHRRRGAGRLAQALRRGELALQAHHVRCLDVPRSAVHRADAAGCHAPAGAEVPGVGDDGDVHAGVLHARGDLPVPPALAAQGPAQGEPWLAPDGAGLPGVEAAAVLGGDGPGDDGGVAGAGDPGALRPGPGAVLALQDPGGGEPGLAGEHADVAVGGARAGAEVPGVQELGGRRATGRDALGGLPLAVEAHVVPGFFEARFAVQGAQGAGVLVLAEGGAAGHGVGDVGDGAAGRGRRAVAGPDGPVRRGPDLVGARQQHTPRAQEFCACPVPRWICSRARRPGGADWWVPPCVIRVALRVGRCYPPGRAAGSRGALGTG
mmetsp:Transcript_40952/g.107551  ORF Transcript_40952/g.107551 Transcript_40952/m.107551 type:complete len:419 (-) Transcript_40952:787-2043(-)